MSGLRCKSCGQEVAVDGAHDCPDPYTVHLPARQAEPSRKERPILPEDLYAACRLALEGTERDRILFARLMMQKYPHIEELKELNGRHMKMTDILR